MSDDDDELEADGFACDTIRSSSTSFVRGPTCSSGVGSNRDSGLSTSRCNSSASSNGTDTNTLGGGRQRSSTSLSESALNLYPTLIITIPTVYLTKSRKKETIISKNNHNNPNKLSTTDNNNGNHDTAEQTQQTATTSSGVSSSTSSSASSASSTSANPSEPLNSQSSSQGLFKKAGPSYHAYQVTLRASSCETWSVYRRYSEFYSLHSKLKTVDSKISKRCKLPPKRTLNSKSSTIVQERRVKLEEYLNNLAAYVDRHIPLDCLTLSECSHDVVGVEESSQLEPSASTTQTPETITENAELSGGSTSRLGLPTPSLPIDIPGNEADFGDVDFDEEEYGQSSAIRCHHMTDKANNVAAGGNITPSASSSSFQSNNNNQTSDENPNSNEQQQPKHQQQQSIPESSDPQTQVRNLFYEFISFGSKKNEPVPEMAHRDSLG